MSTTRALPVLTAPYDVARTLYRKHFGAYRLITVPYASRYLDDLPSGNASAAGFVYRVCMGLLITTSLHLLLEAAPGPHFVPLVRLHLDNKQQPTAQGGFIRALAMQLAHLLSDTHVSSTQGFDVSELAAGNAKDMAYRVRNGLASLYAVVPKRFIVPESLPAAVEKLAIVVVSSRESDRRWGSDERLATLIGEAISVTRLDDHTVEVQQLTTFTDTYPLQQLRTTPTALIDTIGALYAQGYRHVLYLAKSPYARTLHLTEVQEDDYLFFMSRSVMRALREQRPDLHLYPAFFDNYWVVKLPHYPKGPPTSLFIQDVEALTEVLNDPSKRVVLWFNLFNGITVTMRDDKDARYYNSVASYTTLLNSYEGILDDKAIFMGLLIDDPGNPVKQAILTYLTLFHFSRYEAAPREGRITIKLDPYSHLIGSDSVGANATIPGMLGNGTCNLLAILAEVRTVLRGRTPPPSASARESEGTE